MDAHDRCDPFCRYSMGDVLRVKNIIYIFLFLFIAYAASAQNAASPSPKKGKYVDKTLYIKFYPSAMNKVERKLNYTDKKFQQIGLQLMVSDIHPFDPSPEPDSYTKRYGLDRIFVLTYDNEVSLDHAIDMFASCPSVERISPRPIFQSTYIPNDPRVADQWYLSTMKVQQAWDAGKGNANTVIAILDDGINYQHEDLLPNLFINPGEDGLDAQGQDKRTNGKDDDRDGYVDNWRGWDFVGSGTANQQSTWKPDNDPSPPLPSYSHGTSVAGCAAGKADNGIGIAGPGFNCTMMPIKTGDKDGTLIAGYEGIHYASTHGAKIINCSWGGQLDDQYVWIVEDIINAASDRGSLVVASAGNDGNLDNDLNPFYPANIKNALSVGATGQNDKATSFSHFGASVDVFAPGQNIVTTGYPGNNTYNNSFLGTSASAPIASGVAGLLAAKYPNWKPKHIARQLVETCDNVVNPQNRSKYWGRINAYNAMSLPTVPGLVITGFKLDGVDNGQIEYLNKKYSLEVTFKNVMFNGTGLTATLMRVEGYRPNQPLAQLGTMAAEAEKSGTFQFTRDSTDDSQTLPMYIIVADGTGKYRDTLRLTLEIIADDIWVDPVISVHDSKVLDIRPYPNPATDHILLPIPSDGIEQWLIITDMLGRVVYREDLNGSHGIVIDVDTRTLTSGIYRYSILGVRGTRIDGSFSIVR
jgi:subtilisin family serine protease